MVKNLLAMQETWVLSLSGEDPLEKGMQPTQVFFPGEFHGQRSLVGYSPWGHKELDTTERLSTQHNVDVISGYAVDCIQSFFTWRSSSFVD